MKLIDIYTRNDYFYLVPMAIVARGLYIGTEPIVIIADNISDETLGQKILDTVALPEPEVPKPGTSTMKPLLKAAKVRSNKAFMSGSELISLENIDGAIKLLPWTNNGPTGPKRGYEPMNGAKERILLSDCTPAELGNAVRQLFQEIISGRI